MDIEARPRQATALLSDWVGMINACAAGRWRAAANIPRVNGGPLPLTGLLLGAGAAGVTPPAASASFGLQLAPDLAEYLVGAGLDPDVLGDFAALSGLDPKEVLDFAGIDRTTVSRRKASGSPLPHEAAVKALQAIELMALAAEVFGAPREAAAWLTRPHPLLDGETPLRRARTPWGLSKVRAMLVALRYGGAV
jgi:putative toxin-antitoxin system antitoxin component (TIGR02293 family)